jgi:hypothetical protein
MPRSLPPSAPVGESDQDRHSDQPSLREASREQAVTMSAAGYKLLASSVLAFAASKARPDGLHWRCRDCDHDARALRYAVAERERRSHSYDLPEPLA